MGRSKHRRTAPPSQSEHSDDERENHDQSNCEPEDKLDYEYLVDLLVKYGRVLLTKSRVPSVLIQKKAALEAIANRIFTEKQIRCSETQIMRRVAVYKSRLKQKTDVKQTGNRKIVLSDAEKRFWKLMDGDSNPTLTKVECKYIFDQAKHIFVIHVSNNCFSRCYSWWQTLRGRACRIHGQ